eukprot:12897453-Prorocentrum_lima.AAC.1
MPNGNKCKITEKMLLNALEKIYKKEDEALMNLSEVQTFNLIHPRARWSERQTVCIERAKSMDK